MTRRGHKRSAPKPGKPSPAMLTITDGTVTAGFILSRGPAGFEAFDRDCRSIGLFSSQREAVMAIPIPK